MIVSVEFIHSEALFRVSNDTAQKMDNNSQWQDLGPKETKAAIKRAKKLIKGEPKGLRDELTAAALSGLLAKGITENVVGKAMEIADECMEAR